MNQVVINSYINISSQYFAGVKSGWSLSALFTKKKGFTEICMVSSFYEQFKQLRTDYGGSIVPSSMWENLTLVNAELLQERKEISISVFGQHNCGKSTFIDALIGDK